MTLVPLAVLFLQFAVGIKLRLEITAVLGTSLVVLGILCSKYRHHRVVSKPQSRPLQRLAS